jgi:hypothetical protein
LRCSILGQKNRAIAWGFRNPLDANMMLRGLSRVSNNLTDGLCLREKAFHEAYVAGHFKFIVRIPREHYVSGPAAEVAVSKKSETQVERALMMAIFMAMP